MLHFSKAKQAVIWVIVLLGLLFSIPNFLPTSILGGDGEKGHWPEFLPRKTVNLGLDLQGGSYLLFEVDTKSVRSSKLESTQEEVRQFLRSERPIIPVRGLRIQGNSVTFRLAKPQQMELARKRLKPLMKTNTAQIIAGNPQSPYEVKEDAATGRFTYTITESKLKQLVKDAVVRSVEVVRSRITELGAKDPTVLRQGDARIVVEVPGESNPQRVKRIVEKTAKMTFHMVDTTVSVAEAQAGRVPPGTMLVKSDNPNEPELLVQRRSLVDGTDLKQAHQTFQNGRPVVAFEFNARGALKFGKATSENVGRRFAILLDGQSITAPRINSPIMGGSGIIEGGFSVQSANDLAILLRAGALPAKLIAINERSIGPGLGKDSIKAGANALIIGFIGVMIYMLMAYGLFGVFANSALIANLILMMGALSGLQATLTLPGIAGVILTVGMAVDANVLIFERIREELRLGRTPMNAVESGYAKARSTILDANITTLIAAGILLLFGSGPVQGFGVTLAIGIFTSVFTAFVFSRLLASYWMRRARPKTLVV